MDRGETGSSWGRRRVSRRSRASHQRARLQWRHGDRRARHQLELDDGVTEPRLRCFAAPSATMPPLSMTTMLRPGGRRRGHREQHGGAQFFDHTPGSPAGEAGRGIVEEQHGRCGTPLRPRQPRPHLPSAAAADGRRRRGGTVRCAAPTRLLALGVRRPTSTRFSRPSRRRRRMACGGCGDDLVDPPAVNDQGVRGAQGVEIELGVRDFYERRARCPALRPTTPSISDTLNRVPWRTMQGMTW